MLQPHTELLGGGVFGARAAELGRGEPESGVALSKAQRRLVVI